MDWVAVPVSLEDKSTRSLRVLGIVLDDDCGRDTVNQLTGKDAVLGYLVVAVGGDQDVSSLDEVDDATEGVAHVVYQTPAKSVG